MNKGINWQRAVATDDTKHCGLLYPDHTNRPTDGTDSNIQGPYCCIPLQPLLTYVQHCTAYSTSTVHVNRMGRWLEGNNGKLAGQW